MFDRAANSENSVRTSAARVTGRRHSAWVSRRIAETMIPAWLMPIQNTKLVIRKPQYTGLLTPSTPGPWLSSQPYAPTPVSHTRARNPKPPSHHLGMPSTSLSRLWFISLSVA